MDAAYGAGPGDSEFTVIPATAELVRTVEERGGGPGDVSWIVSRGIAQLAGGKIR